MFTSYIGICILDCSVLNFDLNNISVSCAVANMRCRRGVLASIPGREEKCTRPGIEAKGV